MDDELPDEVELRGLVLLGEEEVVSSAPVWLSVLLPGVDGYELLDELLVPLLGDVPELIEPGELIVPDEVESEREPAPEPAPEPMLPEVVSRGALEDGDDDERLLLLFDLVVSREVLFAHFAYSDCDSAPSLLASAAVNAPLRSELIAASVCEMRPSRFESSDENVAVPEAAPWLVELLDPIVLLGPEVVLLPRLLLLLLP